MPLDSQVLKELSKCKCRVCQIELIEYCLENDPQAGEILNLAITQLEMEGLPWTGLEVSRD